jgi:hypothetical protein
VAHLERVSVKVTDLPLRETMCATCPFRPGSKYENLAQGLAESALNLASRICHSTGSNNGINKRTGKPFHLCRGARDVQLALFAGLRFIDSATDEAWNKARSVIGLKPTTIKNP